QMRKFLLDKRQVSFPGGRLESYRASADVGRTGLRHALHERLQIRWIVGDARQHRHAVDSDVDPRLTQSSECADSRFRSRRTRLDTPRKLAIEGDERDVNREVRNAVDARQDIDVPRYERTFCNDRDAQTRVLGKHLENPACDAK